jgi:catechol 2,3-dioxygenase-like lactoylglutathione lyase family enzyme
MIRRRVHAWIDGECGAMLVPSKNNDSAQADLHRGYDMSRANVRRLPMRFIVFNLSALVLPCTVLAQSIFTHVHMRVANTAEAAAWHHELFGANVTERGPGPSLEYGNGLIMTMPTEGETPRSEGGVIDHFGIAVGDVAATVAKAREMGAQIRSEPRIGVTAETIAFIEDPWGARMELLEDPVYLGVNHVHMMANDPDMVHAWFLEVFGGEDIPERGKGIFHTILYGDMWVHISKPAEGVPAPSRYRALDHMGFRVPSLEAFGKALEASGYEPYLVRPNPPRSDLMFFEGPEGIHFEISEITAH